MLLNILKWFKRLAARVWDFAFGFVAQLNLQEFALALLIALFIGVSALSIVYLFNYILLLSIKRRAVKNNIDGARVSSGYNFKPPSWLLTVLISQALLLLLAMVTYVVTSLKATTSLNVYVVIGGVFSEVIVVILFFLIRNANTDSSPAVNKYVLDTALLVILVISLIVCLLAITFVLTKLPSCTPIFLAIGSMCILSPIIMIFYHIVKQKDSAGLGTKLRILFSKQELSYDGSIFGLLVLTGFALLYFSNSICSESKSITGKVNGPMASNSPSPTPPSSITPSLSPSPSTSPTPSPELVKIKDDLDSIAGKETKFYKIKKHPRNNVVTDSHGDYYEIKLKDAKSGKELFFNPGRYTDDEFGARFNESMDAVREDILKALNQGHIEYKIYVKGSADKLGDDKPVIDKLIDAKSIEIKFLEKSPNDPLGNQWVQKERAAIISETYNNKDLPNLRGWYTQDKLLNLKVTSTILDGSVTDKINPKDRVALILLFWPDK